MGPVNRLIGKLGTGVGAVAEYTEHRKSRKPAQITPSASEAGDEPDSSTSRQQAPSAHAPPPTYTESVGHGSDRALAAGSAAQGDNKIQLDDDLHGDESSDFEEDSDITLSDLENDEAIWALDDFGAEEEPPSYEDATNVPSEDDLISEIIASQQAQEIRGQLPCPVIIPQRRPRNKSRGFVRAYAPVLQNVGIDQTTFLKFLTNFHKTTQASPWFTVIEVSGMAAHAAGPAIGFAVEAAVKTAVNTGRNLEVTRKTNNFLDRMNAELFKPAGCVAFLMKYKTDATMSQADSGFFGVAASNVNLATNQVVAKYGRESDGDGMAGVMNKMQMFRIAEGTTQGADDLPTSAPLVFPNVDDRVAHGGNETFQNRTRDAQDFLQDYLDRRAQIKFSRQDSKSGLNIPGEQTEMKSKLADPDHPMFNTGIVGLLTGGYLNLQSIRSQRHQARRDRKVARSERRQERKEEYHERRLDRHQRRMDRNVRHFEKKYGRTPSSASLSSPPIEPLASQQSRDPEQAVASGSTSRPGARRHGRRRRRRGGIRGTVSKIMTEDVVYLMIVNLPEERTSDGPADIAISA